MKIRGLVIAGVLVLAGSARGEERSRQNEVDNFVAQVREGLDKRLVDYPSARFKDVRISTDLKYACGEVNSRNQMGGMTGWAPFYGVPETDGVRIAVTHLLPEIQAGAREDCGPSARVWLPQDFSEALKFRD
ncbi:hypothetical protein D3C85_1454360 [compost metagenome]